MVSALAFLPGLGAAPAMQQDSSYCENCGSEAALVPLFEPRHQARRCRACGGWTYVGQVESSAERLYDRDYFTGGEYADYDASVPAQRSNFRRKLRWLSRAGVEVRNGSRVLEIGCATGVFLEMLRDRGVKNLVGLEVSAYARERAQASGFTVLAPSEPEVERVLVDLRPDLIVGWDVWEHLERPATMVDGYLRNAHREVAVALTTVDASSVVARVRGPRWRQFHPPTHLRYPTRASLQRFFANRAMQVFTHRPFGYYRPALEYLRALGMRFPERERDAWYLRLPVYLNLMDTQFVLARRVV